MVKAIQESPNESRKEWMLQVFKTSAKKSSNVKDFQFWRHDNKPIELLSNKVIDEKLNYLHNNPVQAGFVMKSKDYLYSSATDYCGVKGLLDGVAIL